MIRLKTALAAAMSLAALTATAETVDCLTVRTADGTQKFAISEIKEVTFADDGITVIKNDGGAVSFAAEWQMSFGPGDLSTLVTLPETAPAAPASVYTIDGVLVGTYNHLNDVRAEDLAPGTYVIVSNGKTIKIQR